ncbi:hypothetical protein P4O66_000153 [Electrophorus voltai]|uniref:G-protein coupled receptors family 1 profile domain-containing protein n=1 Tax=Electrophorus voltai TaxID=2609070 RepID=A0AAD9E6K4_9TELE|nr:hypothetical protein P4O66_000153 [Electrophorus voltai]
MGLISDNDERAYLEEIKHVENWCQENNLLLNVSKTKELLVDCSKKQEWHYQAVRINGTTMGRVDSFRYLGIHISQDLSWSRHTNSLAKKARQCLYHLRRLRDFRLPSKVLRNFYTCTIESILMGNITVWFGNSTKQDRQALQRVLRSAECITHTELPDLQTSETSDELTLLTMDSMDFTLDYSDYDNYTVDNLTYEEVSFRVHPTCSGEVLCIALVVINALIFLLGIVGNGMVIWIAGFKMKNSVSTTWMKKLVNTTWYLSLAVSDFLFCAFLPFHVVYLVKGDWVFGLFLCKFQSFIMFINMFSSIFLLLIISMDRCVVVMFPV